MAAVTAPTRIAIQNIIVATDFSAYAYSALKYQLIATVSDDGTARFWDLRTGQTEMVIRPTI